MKTRSNDTRSSSFPEELGNILRDGKNFQNDNRLMPNKEARRQLRTILKKYNLSLNTLTRKEWYNLISEKDILESLFLDLENGMKQKLEDQHERARILVQILENDPNKTSVTILDGHGRFLYCLLKELRKSKKSRVRNIQIIVVDQDPDVHKWHCIFFPKDVDCFEGNIFDQKTLCCQSNFFYFNFCGIGGKKGIRTFLILNSQEYNSGEDCCLVSFSHRGHKCTKTIEDIFPPNQSKRYDIEKVTVKNNFLTYRFTRNDYEEDEDEEAEQDENNIITAVQCCGVTSKGLRCKKKTKNGQYCHCHRPAETY